MTHRELIEAGRLADAVAQVTAEVRSRPADPALRITLFELLAFQGDLERAAKQLDVVGTQGIEEDLAVQQYRHLLAGEATRRKVFAGTAKPKLGDPSPGYTEHYLRGLHALAAGDAAAAAAAFEQGEGERPLLSGTLNGTPFDDFRDADDRLGPFLELFLSEEYHWIPWEMIQSVTLDEPKQLRNLLWAPISFLLHAGPRLAGFTPVLYAGSHLEGEATQLGKQTSWDERQGFARGLGQRVFFAGDAQPALLEIRDLEFSHADESQES